MNGRGLEKNDNHPPKFFEPSPSGVPVASLLTFLKPVDRPPEGDGTETLGFVLPTCAIFFVSCAILLGIGILQITALNITNRIKSQNPSSSQIRREQA